MNAPTQLAWDFDVFSRPLEEAFHMMRLVTVRQTPDSARAECFCGYKVDRRSHVDAQHEIEDHIRGAA